MTNLRSSSSGGQAAAARKTDPYRRSLYGKIEIAKKALGLDDDAYRDVLQRLFGKRSRTQLGNAQLVDLVEHFKSLGFRPIRKAPARAGGRPLADGALQGKIRALWISLHHLGAVREPSEKALVAFCKRVTGGRTRGIDALQWLTPDAAIKAIEALKAMAAREGVSWAPYRVRLDSGEVVDREDPRARVLEAQWRILGRLGAARIDCDAALWAWVGRLLGKGARLSGAALTDAEKYKAIEALGAMVRRARNEAETAP